MVSNYSVEPSMQVLSATRDVTSPEKITLIVNGRPLLASGVVYTVTVRNISSSNGSVLDTVQGNRGALVFSTESIDHVFIYPSPYRGEPSGVTFANIPNNAQVKLYSLNGKFLEQVNDGYAGGIVWDGRDRQGHFLPTGIYLYQIEYKGKKKIGKLSIIR